VPGKAPEVHLAVVYFHAQQALENSLKAALFTHLTEFGCTHDLVKLARLLRERGIELPATKDEFR
jgi:HEPN domain-containing protein